MATKLVLRNEKQKAYVRYGLEIIMMTVMGVTGMIVISIILHMKWAWIPFLSLRKYSGGYHAPYMWVCTLTSCSLLMLCIYVILHSSWGYAYWGVLGIAMIILWNLSPIDSKNKRLTEKDKIKYRKITRILLLIFLLIVVSFAVLSLTTEAKAVSMGIILTAVLQTPCVIKKL